MFRWLIHRSENDGSGTRMPSQVSIHGRPCAGSLAIRRRAWLRSRGAQKNGVRLLWSRAVGLVRPHDAARTRSVVRGHPSICRVRGATHRVPGLRQSEARAAGVSFGQSVLYQALWFRGGPALPCVEHQGRGPRVSSGHEYASRVGPTQVSDLAMYCPEKQAVFCLRPSFSPVKLAF